MSDKIHIRDLRLRTHIGIYEWEKQKRQDVVLNLTLHHDQREAAATDDIARTVDYKALRRRVVEYVESAQHGLVEALAERVAEVCLETPGVLAVDVVLDKPGALRFAASVAVEIHRERPV